MLMGRRTYESSLWPIAIQTGALADRSNSMPKTSCPRRYRIPIEQLEVVEGELLDEVRT